MELYQKHIGEVLSDLKSDQKGLTSQEAHHRLIQHGLNRIKVKTEPLWHKLIEPFANVFMLVLLLAAGVSFLSREFLDGYIIASTIIISALIYYFQRFSTDRILRSLQKYEAQKVEVIRDGEVHTIDTEQLVPGDIFLINEGEKVPADARIIHTDNLRVDESMLTGESIPVSKQVDPLRGTKEIYEQNNMLFQGSFILSGQANAAVTNTGNHTAYGQLAQLSYREDNSSPVQQKIDNLLSHIVVVVVGIALVTFILSIIRGLEFTEAIRFVLTLSVSAVPESLPIAITVVLVLGMRRMAKQKALVRNMRAIENIGIITTIATDKTGTLTKNKLAVQHALPNANMDAADFALAVLLTVNENGSKKLRDPLDTALKEYAHNKKVLTLSNYKLIDTIPFEHQYSMSGNLWGTKDRLLLAVKGAPERIISHSKLNKSARESIEFSIHHLTGQGFRVIAFGQATLNHPIESLGELDCQLEFLGLIAVADELRPEAKPAIEAARSAGVTVRMITGDHYETAFNIGKQLDMVSKRSHVYDSRQTENLSESKFKQAVTNARVFSRVLPEHKHKILSALKVNDITAMTGDGVNDVPALTNAHIGIAMGSGSQIAKEASDMVLLDNNFKSIVIAMREGRIVFSNIRRMLFYLLATNGGEVLTMIGALLIGLPLPLVAVQILWVNLVTDTLLVIPLGLESGEKTVMLEPPRNPKSPILDKFSVIRMSLIAVSMSIISLVIFYIYNQSHGLQYAQTLTFTIIVVMQWANAFNARSEMQSIFTSFKVPNNKFYLGLIASIIMQLAALYGPLAEPLHVVPVSTQHLLLVSGVAMVLTLLVSELLKLYGRTYKNSSVAVH